MSNYRVRYTLATKLVDELAEAVDEKQLDKTRACYGRLSGASMRSATRKQTPSRRRTPLPCPTEREEKRQRHHPSSESSGRWTTTFNRPLCAATVDRLSFNGTIIETGSDSIRLAGTRPEEPAKTGGSIDTERPPPYGGQPLRVSEWVAILGRPRRAAEDRNHKLPPDLSGRDG